MNNKHDSSFFHYFNISLKHSYQHNILVYLNISQNINESVTFIN